MKKIMSLLITFVIGISCFYTSDVLANEENKVKFSISYDNNNWENYEGIYSDFGGWGFYDKLNINLDTNQEYLYLKIESYIEDGTILDKDKISLQFQNTHGYFYVDTNAENVAKIPMSTLNVPRDDYDYMTINGIKKSLMLSFGAQDSGPIMDRSSFVGVYGDINGNSVQINEDGSVVITDMVKTNDMFESRNFIDVKGNVTFSKQLVLYTYSANLLFDYDVTNQSLTFNSVLSSNPDVVPDYLKKGSSFKKVISAKNITLNKNSLTLEKGDEYQLIATLLPLESTEEVVWESSDPNVASVDENGLLITKTVGECVISVKTKQSQISATCKINVMKEFDVIIPPTVDNTQNNDLVQVGCNDSNASNILKDELKAILNGDVGSNTISQNTKDKLLQAIADGKEVTPEIITNIILESKVDKKDKKEMEQLLEKLEKSNSVEMTLVQYLDLGVQLNAGNDILGNIDELSIPLQFEIAISNDLMQGNREFFVIRVHNGVAETLPIQINGNKITFESDKFSTYALGYQQKKVVETKDQSNQSTYFFLLILSVGTIGFGYKRKFSK